MKFLLAIALLIFAQSSFGLDRCMTGSWYDPERDGEGINIEVLEGQTFGYFYTYGLNNHKVWYLFQGKDDRNLTMYGTLKTSEDPFKAAEYDVGTASIRVFDEDFMLFEFQLRTDLSEDNAHKFCLANYCEGKYLYERITTPIPCGK